MFGGILKSKRTRAAESVADFIVKMLQPYGKLPAGALRDPYCIGFLHMVGVHVASKWFGADSRGSSGMVVFEEALKLFAPRHANEVVAFLSCISSEASSQNEAFLRGWKDGDLYMGWKLLNLAPQRYGEAALERFFDHVRDIDSPSAGNVPTTGDDDVTTAKSREAGYAATLGDAKRAVISVGDGGRGFVIAGNGWPGQRFVITAAHCLPYQPPCQLGLNSEELTYKKLLGPLGEKNPRVWARCLFADPINNISVLEAPLQSPETETERYEALTNAVPALRIGSPPPQKTREVRDRGTAKSCAYLCKAAHGCSRWMTSCLSAQ